MEVRENPYEVLYNTFSSYVCTDCFFEFLSNVGAANGAVFLVLVVVVVVVVVVACPHIGVFCLSAGLVSDGQSQRMFISDRSHVRRSNQPSHNHVLWWLCASLKACCLHQLGLRKAAVLSNSMSWPSPLDCPNDTQYNARTRAYCIHTRKTTGFESMCFNSKQAGLTMAHERFQAGLAPEDLTVEDTVGATPPPPPCPAAAAPASAGSANGSGNNGESSNGTGPLGNPAALGATSATGAPASAHFGGGGDNIDSSRGGGITSSQAAPTDSTTDNKGGDGQLCQEQQKQQREAAAVAENDRVSATATGGAIEARPDADGVGVRGAGAGGGSTTGESETAAAAAAAASSSSLVRPREEASANPQGGGKGGEGNGEDADDGVRARRKKRAIDEAGASDEG